MRQHTKDKLFYSIVTAQMVALLALLFFYLDLTSKYVKEKVDNAKQKQRVSTTQRVANQYRSGIIQSIKNNQSLSITDGKEVYILKVTDVKEIKQKTKNQATSSPEYN